MDVFPAIDLRAGRCVRLHQGDFDRESVYSEDPVAQAQAFAAAGARWLHVVDLDAARAGQPLNRPLVGAIAAAVDVPVQAGGGVRSEADAAALLAGGVARVVLGSAAVEDPGLVARLAERHPQQVAAGLDHWGGEVRTRGWRRGSGRALADLIAELARPGLAAFVVTDIARDGVMEGPDLAGYADLLAATAVPVVASGGIGSLEHLRALAGLEVAGRRLAGAIIGKALYEGRFSLAEAIQAVAAATAGAPGGPEGGTARPG